MNRKTDIQIETEKDTHKYRQKEKWIHRYTGGNINPNADIQVEIEWTTHIQRLTYLSKDGKIEMEIWKYTDKN